MDAVIIDRGREPEIAETRITIFDVLDYLQAGWDDKGIAVVLSLGTDQVPGRAGIHRESSRRDPNRIPQNQGADRAG
jgi:hypothetical protein